MSVSIAVIGAGSWGSALALVLARNGHTVYLWAKDEKSLQNIEQNRVNLRYLPGFSLPECIKTEPSLHAAITKSDEILICVPSHAFREVIMQMQSVIRDRKSVV